MDLTQGEAPRPGGEPTAMTATPPTAQLNPPRQSRSRRTLERIAQASLDILATEGPAGLTVQAVVEKAGSSVGSFYARFGGKDDLLDYLGERVWSEALERWNEALVSRAWSDLDFPELVEGSVRLLVDAQRHRSVYLSAIDEASGRRTGAFENFRGHLLTGLSDLLLRRRDEIVHESPEIAVRLGLRSVLGVIDGELSASGAGLDRETLVRECRALLLAYLGGRPDTPPRGEVDFFDVWG